MLSFPRRENAKLVYFALFMFAPVLVGVFGILKWIKSLEWLVLVVLRYLIARIGVWALNQN